MSNSLQLPRTLCFFLKALCGQAITIDLHNDHVAHGELDSVDDRMNITLSKATFCSAASRLPASSSMPPLRFDTLYISGRHVTFVHLPDNINVARTVDAEVQYFPFTHMYDKSLSAWTAIYWRRANLGVCFPNCAKMTKIRNLKYNATGGKRRKRFKPQPPTDPNPVLQPSTRHFSSSRTNSTGDDA